MVSVRGSDIQYVNNSNVGTITIPAAAVAGDFCVFVAEHGWEDVRIPPDGFTRILPPSIGTNVNGAAFRCVLTAAQITAGTVTIGFVNAYYGTIAICVFVGPLSGVRTQIAARSSTGNTSRTLTTDATPVSGDYALYFGAGRFNGTVTCGAGALLKTASNPNSSAALYGGSLGSSGAVSGTFSFTATPTGDYEIIIVVAPNPITGLELQAPLLLLEPLSGDTSNLSVPLILVEPLSDSVRNLLDALLLLEPLSDSVRNLRCPLLIIETLIPIPPEGTVSTELFPGSQGSLISLPGLQWPIVKRPTWSTAVYKGATGVSVRRANMQYPIWEFELSYEFLRDSVNREFQTLLDFFLARQGGFDTFLFKDQDDYLVTNGVIGTADGVTTQFSFKRTFGTYYEKVGQVDSGNTITLYGAVAEAGTIPTTPFQITVAHSATFVQDLGVTKAGIPMVKVASAPAAGQYSVATGVYTFNTANNGQAVVITYRYTILPAGYTVTLPNLVVFGSAPANNLIISADFQFFFNCRFKDDAADFDKFASTFWDLQKIVLETVPQ